MRLFVGGMESHARMVAHCRVATRGAGEVPGETPDPGRAAAAAGVAATLDPGQVHVVALGDLSVESAPPEGPGAAAAHRLGPAVWVAPAALREEHAPDLQVRIARLAHPNLRHPGGGHGLAVGVARDARLAELAARAEAAERFAAGDQSRKPLVRASARALGGAFDPELLLAHNRRQYAGARAGERFDPSAEYNWMPVRSAVSGEPRGHVPAGLVFTPFADPASPPLPRVGFSGVAAHSSREEAVERAVCELIERDAFMWTWIQRVARERVDARTLPDELRDDLSAMARAGWRSEFVNLTLDTLPVILCAIARGRRFELGAACHPDPAHAAAKALSEASVTQWGAEPVLDPAPAAEEVRSAADHVRYHQSPEHLEEHAFLTSSPDTIDLRELTPPDEPAVEAAAAVAEPVVAELTSPATRPFHVVRAFVPGLVPLVFGYDREPLGMPRLAAPIRTRDGRTLGSTLDLRDAGPILPHPFP